jgi:hypothetical protein
MFKFQKLFYDANASGASDFLAGSMGPAQRPQKILQKGLHFLHFGAF